MNKVEELRLYLMKFKDKSRQKIIEELKRFTHLINKDLIIIEEIEDNPINQMKIIKESINFIIFKLKASLKRNIQRRNPFAPFLLNYYKNRIKSLEGSMSRIEEEIKNWKSTKK